MPIPDIFGDLGVLRSTGIGSVQIEVWDEWGTVAEHTANTVVGITLVDRLLEHIGTVDEAGPTVDEIRMETVPGGIAIRPDPRRLATIVEGEILYLEDEFVKQRDEVFGMTGRAIPSADTAARPSHVRLMIVRIDIDPVPTRWEVDLRPHPVRTIMVEEAVPLSPIGIASMIGSIVETDETDRSTIRVTSIVHPPIPIARQHAQSIRESVDDTIRARSREVVRVHVPDRNHGVRCVRRIVVVELRDPVIRLIDADGSGGTCPRLGGRIGHRFIKVRSAWSGRACRCHRE